MVYELLNSFYEFNEARQSRFRFEDCMTGSWSRAIHIKNWVEEWHCPIFFFNQRDKTIRFMKYYAVINVYQATGMSKPFEDVCQFDAQGHLILFVPYKLIEHQSTIWRIGHNLRLSPYRKEWQNIYEKYRSCLDSMTTKEPLKMMEWFHPKSKTLQTCKQIENGEIT